MKRSPVWIPLCAYLILIGPAVPAQAPPTSEGTDAPAWVLYQTGEHHFRQRRFSRALELYGDALENRPVFPEAMVGMARVHRAAGDATLAKRYYRRALDDSHQLVVPDEEYAIRIELAELYAMSGTVEQERLRREQLETVVARDPVFTPDDDSRLRDAMVELLYASGLDRVLVLYRLDFPQALEAHRRLGVLLLDSPDGEERERAVEHLLFAAVEIAGRAIRAIIDMQFDYEFADVPRFLATAREFPDVDAYLQRIGFRDVLFDLADALDAAPDDRGAVRAAEIRDLLRS